MFKKMPGATTLTVCMWLMECQFCISLPKESFYITELSAMQLQLLVMQIDCKTIGKPY